MAGFAGEIETQFESTPLNVDCRRGSAVIREESFGYGPSTIGTKKNSVREMRSYSRGGRAFSRNRISVACAGVKPPGARPEQQQK